MAGIKKNVTFANYLVIENITNNQKINKMKKYLFIILGIALAIVSCKKKTDEPTPQPQPVDIWLGSYEGSIDANGTIISEPWSLISGTLFSKTLENLPMTIKKLTSQRAIVTIKYGVLPIVFNADIDGNTATFEKYELIPGIDLPVTIAGFSFNLKGIEFSDIVLKYNDGVVTGSGNAIVTAEPVESTLLINKITLNLALTPNYTKK